MDNSDADIRDAPKRLLYLDHKHCLCVGRTENDAAESESIVEQWERGVVKEALYIVYY